VQKPKDFHSSFSTGDGMQIDCRDEQATNTDVSVRTSREFDSNVTLAREVQLEKQHLHMISTEAGMQIDLSDEQS
jgi:hypothetical protein